MVMAPAFSQDSPLFSHSFSLWQVHAQDGKVTLNHGSW
jgi:hypothetical protein